MLFSAGLGKELATAALARGEKVIATGRAKSLVHLDELKALGAETLELDVTASQDDINAVAQKAITIYGRVDVVVNNAGRSESGFSMYGLLMIDFIPGYAENGVLEENTYVPLPINLFLHLQLDEHCRPQQAQDQFK